MAPEQPDTADLRRRGRAAGIALFSLLVTAFTVVCSAQVLAQVWAPTVVPTSEPCNDALRGLVQAVERARLTAAQETRGERMALERFRHALQPEWSTRPALSERCKADPSDRQSLKLVDWLRYAEEHAVRYEAMDLAELRRKTAQWRAQPSSP